MVKKIVTALVLIGALTGCTIPHKKFTHPDFSETGWRKDSYECERDMLQAYPRVYDRGVVEGVVASQFYDRCLEARGYTRVRVN
jgi:hypothetical protein